MSDGFKKGWLMRDIAKAVVRANELLPPTPPSIEEQLTAARTEIDRLLTLTSEQATEIVGLKEQSQTRLRHLEAAAERVAHGAAEVERQSVLLNKAETAFDSYACDLLESLQEGLMTDAGLTGDDRRAMSAQIDLLYVMREEFPQRRAELQLKGK